MKNWIIELIYKPGKNEIYWEKIISIFTVFAILGILIYLGNTEKRHLKNERDRYTKYTIGITIVGHEGIKGPLWVDYSFYFLKNKYFGANTTFKTFFYRPEVNGGRYYVKFSYLNPKNSEMLFDYPVPDDIVNVPDSGWNNIPGYPPAR